MSASNNFTSSAPAPGRLLSVPETVVQAVAASSSSAAEKPVGGVSFWRYFVVFLILCFLGLNLILFLYKPTDASISHLYDPIIDIFKGKSQKAPKIEPKDKSKSAIKKLEKALEIKPVVNNIDNKQIHNVIKPKSTLQAQDKLPKKRNPPVIPVADDSTSNIQMNPTSKAGFCYIGEDRGFRSCINVGDGDTCMSGDIFPTEAICINPNLRE
jgi:hypothetical protein